MLMRNTTGIFCTAIGLAALWSAGEMTLGQVSTQVTPKNQPATETNPSGVTSARSTSRPARGTGMMRGGGDSMIGGGGRGSTLGSMRSGGRGGMMGGYGRGGMGGSERGVMGNAYDSDYGDWDVVRDPEMVNLLEQDQVMEQQSRLLAQKYLASQGADRDTLRKELVKLATAHFESRQKRRQMEIEGLEKQLERVKAALDQCNDAKDLIIKRRISKLLGEVDELAF